MKLNRTLLRSLILALAALRLSLGGNLQAQETVSQANEGKPGYSTDLADMSACKAQLNKIYGAIQEYRKRHDEKLPDKLSDLTPDLLHDEKVLTCPFVQNRGGVRVWKKRFRELSPDPHTSYSYEFPPSRLESNQWRGVPEKTWRDFKYRLAEVLGPVVPIVRCHDHQRRLNLALNGEIYDSEGTYWERKFSTNDHLLTAGRLFSVPAAGPLTAADFPPRDPRADVRLLDLSHSYNATLTNAWHGFSGNHLAALPPGIHEFNGTRFDIRGVIQLRGTDIPADFPPRVARIEVRQKCAAIHFLHALSFAYKSGTARSRYVFHYSDNETREFPLVTDEHIGDWWYDITKQTKPTETRVAWTGRNEAATAYGMGVRLYHAVWNNPRPDTEIVAITFEVFDQQYQTGPFVVAITLE